MKILKVKFLESLQHAFVLLLKILHLCYLALYYHSVVMKIAMEIADERVILKHIEYQIIIY